MMRRHGPQDDAWQEEFVWGTMPVCVQEVARGGGASTALARAALVHQLPHCADGALIAPAGVIDGLRDAYWRVRGYGDRRVAIVPDRAVAMIDGLTLNFLGIESAEQCEASCIHAAVSRLRVVSGVRPKVRATCAPGTSLGPWVKLYGWYNDVQRSV